MKILVISDIHANLTALETVLDDAGEVEAVWCLGDLVGYGPDPNECVERVRALPNLTCLVGNHDIAVLGRIDLGTFNHEAQAALRWTQEALTPENVQYLGSLPDNAQEGDVTLVHGSPRQPIWEYLLNSRVATANFEHFDTDYCLVGHTHLPIIYHLSQNGKNAQLLIPDYDTPMELTPRAILNPGSVGQPRDRDPRAAYMLFDPEGETCEYHRVKYDIAEVQARMQTAKLPGRHISRLEFGW
jgi:predicted phosphodiesterase